MRMSRHVCFGFWIVSIAVVMAGWVSADGRSDRVWQSSSWQAEELPFAYDAMEQDVVIQLREEPRLRSPIRTIVGDHSQAYALFFREPMEAASVEAAIRRHAREAAEQEGWVEPLWDFRWVHGRQLHLLATLPDPSVSGKVWSEYVIHAGGAKTLDGKALADDAPAFWAVWFKPQQVWKVSADGGEREPLTRFSVFYNMSFLDPDSRYLLLSRYQQYCECDARYPQLYSLYDLAEGKLAHYPVELVRNYRGYGDFVADRRGFFYAWPGDGAEVPHSEWATRVQLDAYVHGAGFSRDRRHLLMAVGEKEQQQDLDLLVYDLEAGKVVQRLAGAVQGTIPKSELDGSLLPVAFQDDGQHVTFAMREPGHDLLERRLRYDWKTGAVSDWNPPVPNYAWSGYMQSDDGKYRLYWNAGLFEGERYVAEWPGDGVWIPGTHQLAFVKWDEADARTKSLYLYDADLREERLLAAGLPWNLELLGASPDGKWVYVASNGELGKH